jgi:hypothetical protein
MKKSLIKIYGYLAPTEGSRIYIAVVTPCSTVFKNYPSDISSIPDMVSEAIGLLDLVPNDKQIEFPSGINNRYIGKDNEKKIREAFKERRSMKP